MRRPAGRGVDLLALVLLVSAIGCAALLTLWAYQGGQASQRVQYDTSVRLYWQNFSSKGILAITPLMTVRPNPSGRIEDIVVFSVEDSGGSRPRQLHLKIEDLSQGGLIEDKYLDVVGSTVQASYRLGSVVPLREGGQKYAFTLDDAVSGVAASGVLTAELIRIPIGEPNSDSVPGAFVVGVGIAAALLQFVEYLRDIAYRRLRRLPGMPSDSDSSDPASGEPVDAGTTCPPLILDLTENPVPVDRSTPEKDTEGD